MTINKAGLSERDICTQFITPAVVAAGWELATQVREELPFTAGQILVKGKAVKRGNPKRVDFLLFHRPNLPIALIEAKDNTHSIGSGMQQALAYADDKALDLPFVFSSNGDGFLFHDKTATTGDPVEQELPLDRFPSPAELWSRYCRWKGITPAAEAVVTQDFYSDGSGKAPRYYQLNAINRVVEAIAAGQPRALLVMATGTGKTFTLARSHRELVRPAHSSSRSVDGRSGDDSCTLISRCPVPPRADDQSRHEGPSPSPSGSR